MDYANGKIYRLVCNNTGKQYIGSTTQPLYKRKNKHAQDCKGYKQGKNGYITSYEIIEGGNYDIILVENFPCQSKEQLHARERYFIETMECVNKLIPTRTYKEYYEENKKEIYDRKKPYIQKWMEENQEHRKDYMKQYREGENREKLLEAKKDWYEKNKEERSRQIICECGYEVRKDGLLRHQRTKKHLDWEQQQK